MSVVGKKLEKAYEMTDNTCIDLGDKCVHCKQDTSFGSGRFVNRYPVFGLDPNMSGIEYDGYCCDECEQEWIKEND